MALTAKQEQFVREYLVDLNATQAAIRAGYSERTANEQAARLMKSPAVVDAINAAKDERSTLTKITAGWVLQRLADEANADLADLYDADGNLLPVDRWPLIWRRGLVQGVDVEVIGSDGDGATVRIKKIRVSDRIRRLELIGKHVDVSAFAENHRVEVQGTLAERLQRAIDRRKDDEDRADRDRPAALERPAVIARPDEPKPPAPAGNAPDYAPQGNSEDYAPSFVASHDRANAAIIGATQPAHPAWTPMLPAFPERQAFCDGVDYRPLSDD